MADGLSGIELRHLRYFAEVAAAGSVTGAARRLRIAQPSLSQQIRLLEARVGAALFERVPQGMVLTEAGRTLLAGVRRAEAELRGALVSIRGEAAVVAVGVCRGVPEDVLAEVERIVGGPVRYEAVESDEQPGLLAAGRLGFGVLRLPVDGAGLTVRVLADEPLGVVVGAGHPLAERDSLGWSELTGQRLLWFPESRAPGFAAEVLGALAAHGWSPRTVLAEHPGHAVFRRALTGDAGLVALRPRAAVAGEPGLAWIPVGPNPPRERLALVACPG